MLVGTIDGAVDGDIPIDATGRVGFREHSDQHTVPRAISGVAVMAFPYRLPESEVLTRQIAPGDACTISIDDSFDYPAIVLRW